MDGFNILMFVYLILLFLMIVYLFVKKKNFDINKISIINLVLFLAMLGINYVSIKGMLSGLSHKMVVYMYNTSLMPAHFVFEIWMLIYFLLGLCLLIQLTRQNTQRMSRFIRLSASSLWLLFSFNIAWNITFTFEALGLSIIFIILYWVCLISINSIICEHSVFGLSKLAYGIHLGWISAMSLVNISAFLVKANWNVFGIDIIYWDYICLAVGILFGVAMVLKYENVTISLAMAWAYYGIFKNLNPGSIDFIKFINLILLAGIGIFLILSVYIMIDNR